MLMIKKINLIQEEEINKLNEEIKACAENLKISTNDISKTLMEMPDIPKNLLKEKKRLEMMKKNYIFISIQNHLFNIILGNSVIML